MLRRKMVETSLGKRWMVFVPSAIVVFTLAGCGNSKPISSVPTVDTSYVLALNAADEFLTAWMNQDAKAGMATVTEPVRGNPNTYEYFSGLSNPHNESFEVTFDKRIDNNTFLFDAWQYTYYLNYDVTTFKRTGPSHLEVVRVMSDGQPKWLVNNLPAPVSK